jgi:hypothetical protein
MSANSRQEGGSHYAGEYQHWDFVCECLGGRYMEGNLTKYVARWRKKNGLQDIRKALHYLLKIRELHESGDLEAPAITRRSGSVERFCLVNDLGPEEARVMWLAASWEGTRDLDLLQSALQLLESEALLTAMS